MKRLIFILSLFISTVHIFASQAEMANIVCFVKFADQKDSSWEHDMDYYERLFNDSAENANSVINYFSDMSFGKFKWHSTIIRTEYTDTHNRAYFLPYNADTNPEGYSSLEGLFRFRLQTLVKDMCAALESQLPEDLKMDCNGDSRVDNLVLVICGDSDSSSANMLWPQNNVVSTAYLNGMQCKNYLTVFDGANGFTTVSSKKVPNPLTTGILCHEMMHTLDAYDLYTTSGNPKLKPVDVWDLMSDNQNVPQGMTAYVRSTYGKKYGDWLPAENIAELSEEGEYSINPLSSPTSEGVAFKIVPDKTRSEYFIIECRDRTAQWDSSLPKGGLLVYRVNPTYQGNLGASDKYELYIFRPGGTTSSAGVPSSAPIGPDTGRTTFGYENDNAYPFYSDGTRAPFYLTDVRQTSSGMTFRLGFGISAVEEIGISDSNGSDSVYNLQGIRVDKITRPGIYIINGKKSMIR